MPDWLSSAAEAGWSLRLAGLPLNEAVNVRKPGLLGYGRATWELNLGCNYDCEHCYLSLKLFEGMDWDQRVLMLHVLRDAGVVWLQMTGGVPHRPGLPSPVRHRPRRTGVHPGSARRGPGLRQVARARP